MVLAITSQNTSCTTYGGGLSLGLTTIPCHAFESGRPYEHMESSSSFFQETPPDTHAAWSTKNCAQTKVRILHSYGVATCVARIPLPDKRARPDTLMPSTRPMSRRAVHSHPDGATSASQRRQPLSISTLHHGCWDRRAQLDGPRLAPGACPQGSGSCTAETLRGLLGESRP